MSICQRITSIATAWLDSEPDGFNISESIEMLEASDEPGAIGKSIGMGVIGFSQVFQKDRPDILVVLGDRFEMYAAALAAVPYNIPLAHIHGGELTQGAIDDALRHSLTKLSHLHFVSTEEYARRVIQLGEEPWRVVVSGALSLDNFRQLSLLNHVAFMERFGILLPEQFLLVSYHPVTLEYQQAGWQISELIAALKAVGMPVLFTMPNADTGNQIIRQRITEAVVENSNWLMIENLGLQGYFSAMRMAKAMVGNSSSGIVEAGMLSLPVVNIGTRQQGRVRTPNIIDVDYDQSSIYQGLCQVLDPSFREHSLDFVSPYGNGHAAETILSTLVDINIDAKLKHKVFYDIKYSIGDIQ
jgi:UDP-hydrolysing UDP-N-acetyl-D-glucosamine 2-epimerase